MNVFRYGSGGLITALTFFAVGCGAGAPMNPMEPSFFGSFSAGDTVGILEATNVAAGTRVDLLARGARISLSVVPGNRAAAGITRGEVRIPPNDLVAADTGDLAGTWSGTGDKLSLQLAADTFLREAVLTMDAGGLRGYVERGGVRIELFLVRDASVTW